MDFIDYKWLWYHLKKVEFKREIRDIRTQLVVKDGRG